jgi:Asp/Glu/hydantoin racemase
VLAAFGDPGLEAARELMSVPVVGLAESSMLTACMLARRFSLVSFAPEFGGWFRDAAEALGLLPRLASVRCARDGFNSIAHVQEEQEAALLALCRSAAEDDGADIVILAGAPLAGLAARVAARVPVPVLDCVAAGIRQAEALAAFPPRPAALRRPTDCARKPVTGVTPALERLFQGGGLPAPGRDVLAAGFNA